MSSPRFHIDHEFTEVQIQIYDESGGYDELLLVRISAQCEVVNCEKKSILIVAIF